MSTFLAHYAVPIAVGAVAVVLLLGLVNMMRGGSPNTSQRTDAAARYSCSLSPLIFIMRRSDHGH